jgi:hypothetical protein
MKEQARPLYPDSIQIKLDPSRPGSAPENAKESVCRWFERFDSLPCETMPFSRVKAQKEKGLTGTDSGGQ